MSDSTQKQDTKITAVLDSCVLYPAQLRDLFMHLALKRVFRPRWSDEIHGEWIAAVLRNRPDLEESQLLRTRTLMDSHVVGCLVKDYEKYIPEIYLPDEKDRHVVAVAIKAEANVIVTFNLKDFPLKEVQKYHILVKHPDLFLEELLDENTQGFIKAVIEQLASLKRPPINKEHFFKILENSGLTKTTEKLKSLNW
jgi:predicted nucleic acid-binding protein